MSQERVMEIRSLLAQLKRKMQHLEWDLQKQQINEFQKQKLEKYREEYSKLQNELDKLQQ